MNGLTGDCSTIRESKRSESSKKYDLGIDMSTVPTHTQKKKHKISPAVVNQDSIKSKPIKEDLESNEESIDPILLRLQMKKNEARSRTKAANSEEETLLAAGIHSHKLQEAKYEAKQSEEILRKLKASKMDPERFKQLRDTQEYLDRKSKRKKTIGDVDLFGITEDEYAISFENRSRAAVFSKNAYEKQRDVLGEDTFYTNSNADTGIIQHVPTAESMNALVEELDEQQQRRNKFHRRRAYKEEKDITYINEANKKYNKLLSRHYDPFTQEIKDNLERGTAL